MAIGYVIAVLAALASGTGSILESLGIRRAGVYGGTSLDLIGLRRQYVYFLGLAVDLLGFLCAAAALHRLPLFLVQSLLAFSIGVTATIATFMGTRLVKAGWVALGVGAAQTGRLKGLFGQQDIAETDLRGAGLVGLLQELAAFLLTWQQLLGDPFQIVPRCRISAPGFGGFAPDSPATLKSPAAGHWHLVIDLGGYPGSVGASVKKLAAVS